MGDHCWARAGGELLRAPMGLWGIARDACWAKRGLLAWCKPDACVPWLEGAGGARLHRYPMARGCHACSQLAFTRSQGASPCPFAASGALEACLQCWGRRHGRTELAVGPLCALAVLALRLPRDAAAKPRALPVPAPSTPQAIRGFPMPYPYGGGAHCCAVLGRADCWCILGGWGVRCAWARCDVDCFRCVRGLEA